MHGGFSVGITVHLIDQATAQLMKLNHAMMQSHQHTAQFQQKLAQVESKLTNLNIIENAGTAMFKASANALEALVDPAKEYAHQLNLMNLNAMDHLEIQKSIQAAWSTTSKVPIMSPTENLRALMDLRTVMGDGPANLQEARDLLPQFGKIQAIITGAGHEMTAAKGHSEQIFAAVKSLEMMGKVRNREEFEHHLEQMTKVLVATGGRVTPQHYQGFLKYARQMKLMLDEDYLYKVAPELILEMGSARGAGAGGGPGSMVAALGRLGVQGIMNKTTLANLMALGLYQGSSLQTTTTGTVAQQGIVGRELLAANSARWVNEILIPAILRQNPQLQQNGKLDEMGINLKMLDIFRGNQLAVSLMQEEYNKRFQFEKFGKMFDKLGSLDSMYAQALQSPAVVDQSLMASWNAFTTALGSAVTPVLLPALNGLTIALTGLSQFFHDNKWAAQLVVAGLAASAVVGALLAVGAAIMSTAIVATLFGIGGVLAQVAGWSLVAVAALTSVFMILMDFEKAKGYVLDFLNNIGGQTMNVLLGWWNGAVALITTGLNWVNSQIDALFNRMMSFFAPVISLFSLVGSAGFGTPQNLASSGINGIKDGFMSLFAPQERNDVAFKIPEGGLRGSGSGAPTAQSFNVLDGAIRITQQPGQDPKALARYVMEELQKHLQEGLLTGITPSGTLFSPAQTGGN